MKNYIIDRQKLYEILLAHKSFISKKCQDLFAQGVDPRTLTFKETNKFTEEFIDSIITELPLDRLLDMVDDSMKTVLGCDSKQYMRQQREKHDS